uniref:Potassium channel AKT1-like n=1 Tax=Tanacetum cinerariifolium TaxID=118510 RepID=A0A6L2KMC4_TANCI|nr:potassium channel AKT1-like [Tanacetum cinerariifolium]
MAQHVIPAAQLVPKYQPIGKCNNYDVLQSIPCSPECKIVRKILLHHPLSYALTVTVNVHAVYLQQFWRTVSKVPNTKDMIKFLLNTEQFVYTMDMFCVTLNLPVETPEKHFVTPANIQTIKAFMNKVGYQGIVDKLFHAVVNRTNIDYAALLWWDFMNNVFQKKEAIQYPRFIKLIIADLMKKFSNIPKRVEEDYHSIKDDVLLVSVYTTRNVLVGGMLIPNAFLTAEIRETDDFKEYETVFMKIDVLMEQPQLVVSTQGTHRSTPRAIRSPTLTTSPQEKKRKQSAKESKKRDDNLGSLEIRTEKTQTMIPTPPSSLRKILSSDKKRQGYMIQNMERKCVTTKQFWKTHKQVNQVLHQGVSQLAEKATEDLIESNLKPCIATTIIEDRDTFRSEDDAPPEREKRVKRLRLRKVQSLQGVLRLRIQLKIQLLIKEKKFILSLHKIHAEPFLEVDLEEKMNRWVRKEFQTFNEDVRLLIQHWKDSWHKRVYKQNQRRVRSLIYLNSKDERWVMYLTETMKFCDATLENGLKEVKLKIFQLEPWRKPPLLDELDRDILRAFEREITKQLSHREQMRRWEYFMTERPILPTMKRLGDDLLPHKLLKRGLDANESDNNGRTIMHIAASKGNNNCVLLPLDFGVYLNSRVADLSLAEKIRYDCDIKATNIILLGLPVNIYTLINHFQTAKEIWDRIKELIEGTELTLQEELHRIQELKLLFKMAKLLFITFKDVSLKGEDHITKQCTIKKRVKDAEWFKEKILLAQAQKACIILHEDQQDFLADRLEEIDDCDDLQLHTTSNFKADHVDGYDSDCDDEVTNCAIDAVVIRDFYKKFYNSIGRVPNRCSSSIGKT